MVYRKEGTVICPEFTIFGFSISSYDVCYIIGGIAVCVFTLLRRKKAGFKLWETFLLLVLCLIFFVVFCRLFAVLALICEHRITLETLWPALFKAGMVQYGGAFGAIIGCLLFAGIRKKKTRFILDYFAPSIALSFAFSRLCCFFEGCCYGIEWSWGITSAKVPGKLLFPVQPLEILCNLLLLALLLLRERIRKTDRYHLEIYLTGYAVCRFVLDFFKAEHGVGFLPFGFTFSQDISILIVLFVIVEALSLMILRHHQEKTHKALPVSSAERNE